LSLHVGVLVDQRRVVRAVAHVCHQVADAGTRRAQVVPDVPEVVEMQTNVRSQQEPSRSMYFTGRSSPHCFGWAAPTRSPLAPRSSSTSFDRPLTV
jgi:hypothetical protein